jgi:plastocyanin
MKATLTRSVAGLALITLVTLVAGCAGSGKPSSSPATKPVTAPTTASAAADADAPDTGVATITISSKSLGGPITANPGEPITVVNKDTVSHTVTSGSAFSVKVKGGGTASFTAPTTPGTYPLVCHAHPDLHGTLTVRGI